MKKNASAATTEPLLLTFLEAAHRLGVGRTTIYTLVGAGELEVVHIGRAARIPIAAIDQFITDLRASAAER